MMDVYILHIDTNLEKDDYIRLLGYVSVEKKERINRFHRFEDAQRSLLGDVLSRYAVCKRLGARNDELVFGLNEYGKPILTKPYGIHFNISHSENWVVCAVDDKPLGIDVESIKPIDFKIAERFFSRDEYLSLMNQPEGTRLNYFYMIWTLKESYIKADGMGLSIPLDSFTIRIESSDKIFVVPNINAQFKKYRFFQSLLSNDTIYAICVLNRERFVFDTRYFPSYNTQSWDNAQYFVNCCLAALK